MDDAAKYRAFFIDNAAEWLADMECRLCEFEQAPHDEDLLNDIFRIVHNIKGTANTVGFKNISSFAHYVEDLLQYLRQDRLVPGKEIINSLFSAVDIMTDMTEAHGGGPSFDYGRDRAWVEKADRIKARAGDLKYG